MKKYNFAIVGATGLVGREMLKVLSEFNLPVGEIKLFATERSKGQKLLFCDKELTVQSVEKGCFKDVDIALFSAGSLASKEISPIAVSEGAVVIDNSNAFRMSKKIPLVIPEINPERIKGKGIIANPNCSTIQMLIALYPIYKKFGISRIIVSTYQAVSGTGKAAIEELYIQTKGILSGKEPVAKIYPHQIAFNCLPHIDIFEENGFTREEMKMVKETKKILSDDNIKINPTAVRVPVVYGHSESIYFETTAKASLNDIKSALKSFDAVKLVDNPDKNIYPLAIDTEKTDKVLVGRLRRDIDNPLAFNMWVAGNNIRKGAALNAVQIASYIINNNLI